jgi:DNA-binding NarL/FixJ family response regulator
VGQLIRVLIADDHAVVRRGLTEILVRELEGAVCDEAENAEQAITKVRDQDWDLLILDIAMPGRSGLDVLRDIRLECRSLPVLIFSMHAEDQYARRMIEAGARGYVTKESPLEELIKATKRLLSGGCYVSPGLAEKLAFDLRKDASQPLHETLSNREFEVLRMLASGKSVSQIAEELNLSVPTVSTYRVRILEKMQMTNTAELIRYALGNRLVD